MQPWAIALALFGGALLVSGAAEASRPAPAGGGGGSGPAPGDGGWTPPPSGPVVPGGRLLQRYNAGRGHYGVDLAAPIGTPVRAAASGTVAHVWPNGQLHGAGNAVSLRHDDGTTATLYYHLADYAVQRGQRVAQGELLGHVGNTDSSPAGYTSTPHLHLEVLALRSARDAEHFNGTTTPPRHDPQAWARDHGVSLVGAA